MLKQPLQGRLMGIILISCGLGICAQAAEPLHWERTPNRPAPAQFDTFHGESLDFRCTFKGFGSLPFSGVSGGMSESGALPPRLYYQTNGMGAAWWSLPATVASNTVSATFPPSADPGAERLTVFFGAPSNAYAAAQVRFRDSPGAQPNNLDPPAVLDWMAELSALSNNLARAIANAAPADYANVSNRAMSALQEHQSLAPSTNYTDATTVSLSNNLAAAMSAALDGKANKSHIERAVYYRNETMDETVDVEMEKIEIWGRVIWRTPWRGGGYLAIAEENGQMRGVIIEEDESDMELVSNVPPYRGFDGYVPGELTFRAYTDLYGQETLIFRYDLASVVYSDEMPEIDTSSLATKGAQTAISNIAVRAESKADSVVAYLQGDDVKEVVTNYDSAVHMPSRSLQQRVEDGGTNYWRVVWNEMTRWDWLTGQYLPANFYRRSEIDELLDGKADRAWGFYDSHTGGWSPDGYLQISSPKILIAAGMAYQRHTVTGGAVWVLESNGLVTEVGGVASNGFFRISDDDGNAIFEIVKGNKRTIGSTASDFATTNIMGIVHCYIPYNVDSAEHPTILAGTTLGEYVSEESADSIVNVAWTGESGAWRAEVWPKVATPRLFIKAEHEVGGETYIRDTVPLDVSGGILCTDGVHRVRPVYSNGAVTWEVVQ